MANEHIDINGKRVRVPQAVKTQKGVRRFRKRVEAVDEHLDELYKGREELESLKSRADGTRRPKIQRVINQYSNAIRNWRRRRQQVVHRSLPLGVFEDDKGIEHERESKREDVKRIRDFEVQREQARRERAEAKRKSRLEQAANAEESVDAKAARIAEERKEEVYNKVLEETGRVEQARVAALQASDLRKIKAKLEGGVDNDTSDDTQE